MIWQQPWAWLGLLAVAAPVIIHLLGLGRSPTQRFPTLRFFNITRLAPTRRTQLHDPWLLLLRAAIVVAAVAALAQPFYRSDARERAYASSLARVVVLDTSVSVQRAGANALDSARQLATNLLADADVGLVLETAEPARALEGAVAWLAHQQQRRELVVISDFQVGAIDTARLQRITGATGVRLLRVATTAFSLPLVTEHRVGDMIVRARAAHTDSGGTRSAQVEWTTRTSQDSMGSDVVRVLASDAERGAVRAAERASFSVGTQLVALQDSAVVRDSAATRAMTIITPGSPQHAAVLASARPPREPWMLHAVVSMQSNRVLQDIAREDVALTAPDSVVGVVVAHASNERPAVWAADAEINGRVTPVLIANVSTESLTFAALLAAARAATAPQLDIAELDTEFLADSVLTRLSHEPSSELRTGSFEASMGASESESDGRWLWLLVLALLGAETVVRRSLRAHERAAVST